MLLAITALTQNGDSERQGVPSEGNVVELMSAQKRSIGQAEQDKFGVLLFMQPMEKTSIDTPCYY